MVFPYTLASGSAADAYDLSDRLDVFLVATVGWTRQYTVSSGAALRDRVYYNVGGSVSNPYDAIYCRLRAENSRLFNYAYTYFSETGSPSYNELGGNNASVNPGPLSGACDYWFLGTLDGFWCVVNNTTSGTYHSSGVGYCRSYFCPSTDSYPVCVVGHEFDSYTFMDQRVQMYDHTMASAYYKAENFYDLLVNGNPQARSGEYFSMSLPLMNSVVGYQEMRGELEGIKQVCVLGSTGLIVSMSGTAADKYLYIKHAASTNAFVYGPVVL